MDQIKIGKFIAERRKQRGLTQMQLAERLCITDKAVSKWERGLAMPDSSIMLQLCDILSISVNDLLIGEVVTMDNCSEKTEAELIEMLRQKEEADRRLLMLEIVLGIVAVMPIIAAAIIAVSVPMEEWQAGSLLGLSLLALLIATPFAIKIEQKAGYNKCSKCGHRHIPQYSHVFFAMHLNRTRYLRCPECGKRSWQKKVISKE